METNKEKAFPVVTADHVLERGMTLRDYFAAKAMQALIAKGYLHFDEEIGYESYRCADVMLKQRSL